MIVHLGVLDVAYADGDGTTTTGDVAEILEANYGVMRTFLELHESEIGDELAGHMMGLLENAKIGAPLPVGDIHFQKIAAKFRTYLDLGEWQNTSGQATQAAEAGASKRKKYKKYDGPRKSFIDTGLYQQSFRVWVSR
ncbi:MAG: hypothetical protein ACYC4K_02890 [Thiobacillus sp.]